MTILAALAFVAVPLAGCMNEEESAERSRGVVVSIPDDVHRLEVEVSADADDDARIQVEIEHEDGTDIVEESFEVSGGSATHVVEADVTGLRTVAILVTVSRGDATVHLVVRGVRDAGDPVVIREETFVIVLAPAPAATPPAADPPTPATATPATTTPGTTPTPPPSPTPETNETGDDNTTNETNSTP